MRLSAPRIAPVDLDAIDDEQREALATLTGGRDVTRSSGAVLNIFRTLVHAPRALTAFLAWGGYILSRRNSLSERDRELVILRTGYNCASGYEFTQHTRIGLDAGLTETEIEAIKAGPDDPSWSNEDRALLRAADDLTGDHHVSDDSWAALGFLSDRQKMDLVMTVGQYTQVSMMLNSFGIQLDPGQELDPALDRR
ncbi:alkylhydroperoxidase family enzyme [Novosphingobium kunmingense]|uniref:Alkylhydroperoxidase family enzyme n=1 Tax=Novosphingobium kunmingense TaxID=1211806 RepID=A0A2N0H7I9_9SPHN|nr:carboxymuconolactone decarboxylase family protein [Novosphingobium kunmingense]PKB14895.1 alkylhydroperoxidase family enzyme [Novosphingobium kunmingense]